MADDEALTIWMKRLRDGDRRSAQQLWEAYYGKLVVLARQRLSGRKALVADEEDVALSAFKSFCKGLEAGRYPQLDDRDDLWRLLVTITLHKTLKLVRNETRKKRGGDWKRTTPRGDDDDRLPELSGNEPTPDLAVELAEEFERLMQRLNTPELRELVILKLEGHTNAEIAQRWNKSERTVERKLGIVRQLWQAEPEIVDDRSSFRDESSR